MFGGFFQKLMQWFTRKPEMPRAKPVRGYNRMSQKAKRKRAKWTR